MATIRITCCNKSAARDFRLLGQLAKVNHCGGRLVIAQVDDSDLAAARELLDDSSKVVSFEVRP